MSNRTQRINILVTEAEKEAILAEAASKNLSLSDHVRSSAMETKQKIGDEELTEAEVLVLSHFLREISSVARATTKRLDKTLSRLAEQREKINALRREHGLAEFD